MAHWPTAYKVSIFPQDHPWVRHFSFTVKDWKDGLWMIEVDDIFQLDAQGERHHHSDYPTREEFIKALRFTKDEALQIAEKYAPEIIVNNKTAEEAWEAEKRGLVHPK